MGKASIQKGKTISLLEKPKTAKAFAPEKELAERQKLLMALEDVSKVLTMEVKLHKILADMARIVAKAMGAKWVNFWELAPNKKAVYITAHYGMRPQYMEHSKQHPIPLGKAWIGRAVKTGKTWATSDILTDPKLMKELGPAWKKAIEKQEYRALLCTPLLSMRGSVGGMCVYYPQVHQFADFEMRLVTVAANQAATAVTNTQIFNELLTEKNKTVSIIHSLQDGLVMYDLDNTIVFFNPRAEELLWLTAKDVIGKKPEQGLKENNTYWKNLYNISQLAQKEYTKTEYTTEGPQKLFLEVAYVPVRNQEDQKIGAMQILRNITREKEVELLKAGFVTTASHQLRTPLSSIKWAIDLLSRESLGPINEKQKELLKRTFEVNENLISLVSDLLDVSKIEEGRFSYEFKQGDLFKLTEKIFEQVKMDVQRRNIDFQLKKPVALLPKIAFDGEKLEIAIRNVVDNAIRYTLPGGSIIVELKTEKHSLFLTIKDNGIGIPKEDQKFIFVKFFRAKNAVRLQTEGSGLGLFIAKSITDKHNATLNFESEQDKGSTFTFQFPLDQKKNQRKK